MCQKLVLSMGSRCHQAIAPRGSLSRFFGSVFFWVNCKYSYFPAWKTIGTLLCHVLRGYLEQFAGWSLCNFDITSGWYFFSWLSTSFFQLFLKLNVTFLFSAAFWYLFFAEQDCRLGQNWAPEQYLWLCIKSLLWQRLPNSSASSVHAAQQMH